MILAGDIGGTNARLALFELRGGRLRAADQQRVSSRRSASLESLLHGFLAGRDVPVELAAFGVAGPVKGDRVVATNLPWVVDRQALRERLGIEPVYLLNDIEAVCHGLDALEEGDTLTLNPGDAQARGNRAVIAAGTGLGQAGLFWDGQRHRPYATEGGHCDFAPGDELQDGLLRFMRARHGSVSWERIVSGPGLAAIHEYLRDVARVAQPAPLPSELVAHDDPAATIANAAQAGACPVASQALDLFVALYGAEAGNLALKTMATGGVFVAGGIAPKIVAKLKGPAFMRAFTAKGPMRGLAESIPVRVVLRDGAGLLGAARYAALAAGWSV